MIVIQRIEHHIFFLSKCPPKGIRGVLKDKISLLNEPNEK